MSTKQTFGRRLRPVLGAVGAAGITLAVAVVALSPRAVGGVGPDPITAVPIGGERTVLTDDVGIDIRLGVEGREELLIEYSDASHVAVVEITVQPGAAFPWHTHPGTALAGLQDGELIYVYADDCVERSYPAGTMFIDPGGDNVHMAFNPSYTTAAVVVVTFIGVPAEGGLTLPVDEAQQAALDEACGIVR
jgi:quercetin dioxygenase-like cupin family protein